MPHTDTTPSLPFQGSTVTSAHCSSMGAVTASETRVWKSERYLTWLLRVGRATDHGAADHFGWPLSSICSIRNGLFKRGLIAVYGVTKGPYGTNVTLWKASDLAREQAAQKGAA